VGLSGRGPHLRQLHGDRSLRGRTSAAPARRAEIMTPGGRRAVIVLAVGFLVMLIGGGARFAIGLTFKPMVDEFGWSRGELGVAVGLYMVISALATFLAGRMADRFSPRTLLFWGTVIGGAGIGLMSLVTQPWHALVLYGVVFAVG